MEIHPVTRTEGEIVFFLGAGASVDAGMPTVVELTRDLRTRIESFPDFDDIPVSGFSERFREIFRFLENYDRTVAINYERLFDWIHLILAVQKNPFRTLITMDVDQTLVQAMAHLTLIVSDEISKLLVGRKTSSDYLARFGEFIPPSGRLKIFTLNYDCCLEDACRAAGFHVTTGFDPITHQWDPDLFEHGTKGINVYKLHGSLRWFGARNRHLPDDEFRRHLVLLELKSEDEGPDGWDRSSSPSMILGPDKILSFDPFVTLLSEFQRAIRPAKTCVIIGYNFGDSHINEIIDRSLDTGTRIIDVNPSGFHGGYIGGKDYYHIQASARSALTDGAIRSALDMRSEDFG